MRRTIRPVLATAYSAVQDLSKLSIGKRDSFHGHIATL
jgi:hypothetical protein